jgi:hypothetical protein
MISESRIEILSGIGKMCRLFPSFRLCQMVANVGTLAQCDGPQDLDAVIDDVFRDAMREVIRVRIASVGHEPVDALELAHPNDTWTLPPLLDPIVRGLEDLSQQYPDKPFVPLVLQVAEWAKEFAPFDFWDVEDADFLRAIQAHLTPTGVAP